MSPRVAVTGATGHMGREVLAAADGRDDVAVAFAASRDPESADTDTPVEDAADLSSALAAHAPDVVIDFTVPEGSVEYVTACADAGIPVVVGTTGFDDGGFAILREASEAVPVLKAANFARGVQALLSVVGDAVRHLPGYDVELVETHHNRKRDAPSGTAKTILGEIEDARETGARIHGREGHAPRSPGEIGVHALRAGDITGIHEVLIAGNHEEVRIGHRTESRGVFAEGALDAAAWLAGRDPGWYDFSNVLEGGA